NAHFLGGRSRALPGRSARSAATSRRRHSRERAGSFHRWLRRPQRELRRPLLAPRRERPRLARAVATHPRKRLAGDARGEHAGDRARRWSRRGALFPRLSPDAPLEALGPLARDSLDRGPLRAHPLRPAAIAVRLRGWPRV